MSNPYDVLIVSSDPDVYPIRLTHRGNDGPLIYLAEIVGEEDDDLDEMEGDGIAVAPDQIDRLCAELQRAKAVIAADAGQATEGEG